MTRILKIKPYSPRAVQEMKRKEEEEQKKT